MYYTLCTVHFAAQNSELNKIILHFSVVLCGDVHCQCSGLFVTALAAHVFFGFLKGKLLFSSVGFIEVSGYIRDLTEEKADLPF